MPPSGCLPAVLMAPALSAAPEVSVTDRRARAGFVLAPPIELTEPAERAAAVR